ncbi:MAG TPA: sensor domain-containing diguanylate cyclase [Phenylobacterium sp.]|nr:sensor domain-containing diguanylate cyclase [Phenylobacterium sp.]
MRISTITNWAYGATLLLTGLSGAAFLAGAQAARDERAAVEQHLDFDIVAEDLAEGSDALTDQARLYAMRGAARHLTAYRQEAGVVRTRDRALERVRGMDAASSERAAITEAERNLADLDGIEAGAVEAAERGDRAAAQATLFGSEHERAQAAVVSGLDHFRALVSARTHAEIRQAQRESDRAALTAKVMLALTALVFLGVLYFVLRRRVSKPLSRLTGVVTRLARQDYDVEVPLDRRRDEIGDITQAIHVFRENGLERDRLEAERRADQRLKDCILQMTHRLQACETRQELADVVACFAPETFPDLAGRLYVLEERRNALTLASSWLEPAGSSEAFPPTACWGVRRGRPHAHGRERHEVVCPHVGGDDLLTLCVPLTAQGDTIGLLYFEARAGAPAFGEASRVFLDLMSDNVALALANLRLRERLASLAERDGLTGLFNRRRLDEAMVALRPGARAACIMADIDHFKRFNDEFGHDAGDAVMQHVAQILIEATDGVGAAYRFGGEEFTVLLPDLDQAAALAAAERIRELVAASPLAHHGRMLGRVTISLGLAVSPEAGPATTLLRCADAALLAAKSGGRNRTVVAAKPGTVVGDRRAAASRWRPSAA